MSKKLLVFLIAILVLTVTATTVIVCAATTDKATLNVAVVTNDEANDLAQTLKSNYNGVKIYEDLDSVLANAASDGTKGIMLLADNYPDTTTAVSSVQAARIRELGIRVYIEYPTNSAELGITDFSGTAVMGYDRAVVTDVDAVGLDLYSIMYVHGAKYVKKTDISNSWIVNATVVGYDTVEFYDETTGELTDCTPYSMLEVNTEGDVLIASTKFSQFISARYAPYARWQTTWHSIISWVAGLDRSEVNLPEWEAKLNPNYGKDEELADDAYSEAVRLNTEWFKNSGLFIEADGSKGLLEAFISGKYFDVYGDPQVRKCLRSDCNAESLGAIALAGVLLENEEYKSIAANMIEWLLNESLLANDVRANLNSDQYGLLSWHDGAIDTYFGDDNAKAIIGLILGATALDTDEYDQRILEAIIANFRTTGSNGFRGASIKGGDIDSNGWEYYFNRANTNYQSHFESLLWACYLWAYNQTGYEPFLDRTKTAIGLMMEAYDNTMAADTDNNGEWYWTNGLQQERAKMLLPLAWLVRIEPTAEHIAWLDKMVTDIIAYQDECGAIAEAYGEAGVGRPVYTQFSKNSDYGKHESPVIQNNGDPCSDSLYTTGFAVMALNEAYAAMKAAGYNDVAERYNGYARLLSDYHVRIQQVGDDERYNGVWFRGFDFEKWETYGSDGDAGWGIWCAETGWCQSWISSTLSLQAMNTNMWDYTIDSKIDKHFYDTATLMLNYDPEEPTFTSNPNLAWAGIGVLNDGVYGSTKYSDGKWTGYEGKDIIITVDLKYSKAFDSIVIGSIHHMDMGISNPGSIIISVSDDNLTYTPYATWNTEKVLQDEYANAAAVGSIIERITVDTAGAKARYVKIELKNPGTFLKGTSVTKTWMGFDEIEFISNEIGYSDLTDLISVCENIKLTSYTPASVLKFDKALSAAKEYIASGANNSAKTEKFYNDLLKTKNALETPLTMTVVSYKNWSNANNIAYLFDGLSGTNAKYIQGKVLSSLNPIKEQELELVIDMGRSTGVYAIGYIAESRSWAGIYMPNAEFFVSDSESGPWVSVGKVHGKAHNGDISVGEFRPNSAEANGSAGRYVKVVFTTCRDYEDKRADGYHCLAEWVFLHEILINKYCKVDVQSDSASVTLTDTDGNDIGILGPRIGEDVIVNIYPELNARPSSVTLNGAAVTITNNSFTISEIATDSTVGVTCSIIPESERPVLNVKDLFFAVGSSYDLLFDVTAKDKNGKDISDNVTIYSHNVGTAAGKYTVTYRVTDEYGAAAEKSANVYLVSGLGGKHVVASTTLSSRISNHQTAIMKLVNGSMAPVGSNCWDGNNVYWQNESAIEIVIYLGGEMGIADLGYALVSCPSMGIIAPDVEFYVSNDVSGGWIYAGKIEATYHASANLSAYDQVNKSMSLKNVKASYVKAIIKYDDDPELRARYIEDCKGFTGKGAQEWTFVSEITVDPYFEVSYEKTEGGSVSLSTPAVGALWGEDATVTVTPDKYYLIKSVTVNGKSVTLSDNKYTVSGITEDIEINVIFEKAAIKSAALRPGESISLVYYAYLPSLDGAEMLFEMNGKSFTVYGNATNDINIYSFVFTGIAPQCMGDNISASLIIDDTAVSTVSKYSVKEYCDSLLLDIENKAIDGYTDEKYAALKQLTVDILEYGAAAQVYRSYKTDTLVNAGVEGARVFTALDETYAAFVGASTDPDIKFVSGGVRFDYVNSMFFKFRASADDELVIRITKKISGTVTEYSLDDCTQVSDGVYVLYTDGILPAQYDKIYTVELISNGTTVQSLEYSIAAYVYYIQNETKNGELTPMAKLARAMYNYGISADEYKNLT